MFTAPKAAPSDTELILIQFSRVCARNNMPMFLIDINSLGLVLKLIFERQ